MNSYGNSPAVTSGVLIIGRREIQELLTMPAALEAVEHAFQIQAEGKAVMPPKIYLDIPTGKGDFRAMPAYIDGAAGIKWVSVYPDNPNRNLPTVLATILLCDADTGCPLAIMDGTYITEVRTGAAGGVAVKYLARKDSSVIGMVGAGVQAEAQLRAISEVLPNMEEVRVFDLHKATSRKYAAKMGTELKVNIYPVEAVEAATEADIVVTTTPSRKPIVTEQCIRPGTHINAIGADARGKQELESGLLAGAKIVVDDVEQACHSGEINVPLAAGLIGAGEIYGTLGEVITEKKKGRENNEEITVFDSTGLAIQDIICAKLVYEKARGRKVPAFDFS